MQLRTFYFAHPQMYLIPVEHQCDDGISPQFAELLRQERGLGDDFIGLLNSALLTYRARVDVLFRHGRGGWFPPRLQNLCIVTETAASRPFYQPFAGASWLLYEADFDPAIANVEFVVFQLLHAERLGVTGDLITTLLQNLSYLLLRSETERRDLAAACRRSSRPDATALAALADAMYWIGELYDEILKPPQVYPGRTLVPLKAAPLLVPQSRLSDLQALIDIFNQTANISVQRYWAFQAKAVSQNRPVAYLCDYLSEQQPRLIIADTCANDIWDPQRPQSLDLLRPALTGLCERAAVSICHDLQIIDAMTRRFFDAVVDPQALPDTAAEIEQDGGVYLHRQRGLIVYALTQPGIDTLREQAPPYHRLLLAARVAHEWGHVAADGGLVALDPQQAAEHAAALRQIGELYQRIIEQAPASASVGLAQEFAGRPAGQTLGAALAHAPLQRIGDYLANLIAAELLPVAAMEAYVRANVRSLFGQPGSPVRRLARYVYEFQYLGFSRMEQPQDYFYASTWFREEYIHTKICTIDQVGRLFALMAQICACYRIDSEQFTVKVVDNN